MPRLAAFTTTCLSLDFSDRSDIHPTDHPTEKRVIGQRLACAAQNPVYGENVSPGGPFEMEISQ